GFFPSSSVTRQRQQGVTRISHVHEGRKAITRPYYYERRLNDPQRAIPADCLALLTVVIYPLRIRRVANPATFLQAPPSSLPIPSSILEPYQHNMDDALEHVAGNPKPNRGVRLLIDGSIMMEMSVEVRFQEISREIEGLGKRSGSERGKRRDKEKKRGRWEDRELR
ncbi:hypothetical protein ACLOJK_004528, partial [Asimina triloba]